MLELLRQPATELSRTREEAKLCVRSVMTEFLRDSTLELTCALREPCAPLVLTE